MRGGLWWCDSVTCCAASSVPPVPNRPLKRPHPHVFTARGKTRADIYAYWVERRNQITPQPRDAPRLPFPPRAARDKIRADVYAYWVERRKQLGRPLMRRLMAPTPVNDQNPYNVFRWVGGWGLVLGGLSGWPC